MRSTEKTYHNLKRLHVWMALSSLALLAVTVWMVAADHCREWKQYQRTFRDRIEPLMTDHRATLNRLDRTLTQQSPTMAKRLLRLPLIDAFGRPLKIDQIWLPELTIDYNFQQVARFDRCVTCHQGIAKGEVDWGKPLVLTIRRGLPQPYCSHPRLDLFVGSLSPHPMTEFGCTICHDGQGSATEFKWASHTPDDPAQRTRWRKQYGWFWNHHWDFPMLPRRFAESRCLKCHHEVTDLEPSERFPDPPAPKLLAGYHLIRQNGCFGCHEIKGVDDSGRSIGPDMRLEPYPGTMRKVGPSLRDTAGRLDAAFLTDWIGNPTNFRPGTRMPRFYGLHKHLDGQSLADAKRFEAVEIRVVVEYLLAAGRPVEPVPAPERVTEPPSAERGRHVFQIHGCLACHKHADFPEGQSTIGPDLSRIGAKYITEAGRRWLAGWIRDPDRHSPRTLMPSPLLEPTPLAAEGAESEVEKPKMTDPAADVAEYLLASDGGYRRLESPPTSENEADLDELALGRRTIRKRGCYGCHDIPGFEDAKPIGPALTDWGRKQESLLAFEQINQYIAQSATRLAAAGTAAPATDPDRGFFIQALLAHRREGFLWQKLRQPRSFDYKKAHNKDYNKWLTMGRFNFTQQQIEAIITFVLGLVAEPPREKYVYQPDARRKAIVEGRKVLDKYACAECHTLEMERWTFEFDPDDRGLGSAEVVGMPQLDEQGELLVADDDKDEQGNELLQYAFTLWEPAAIGGQVWTVGGADVLIWDRQITGRRPPTGGTFARLLYPVALAEGWAAGSSAAGAEAWGWVPPPLVDEGAKVRPAWLYDYLLDPTQIRPAAVLRMPRYNLSPAEAGKLVDYFAAVSGVEFPYSSHPKSRTDRLDDAMKMLVDRQTYCAKCHLIGDFSPGGEIRTILAPNLDQVGRRIRPDYVRRWLANPKSVLPYTGMPVNFPPTGDPMGQDILPGSSIEQLDAVMDLLLNYDWYIKSRISVQQLPGVDAGAKRGD